MAAVNTPNTSKAAEHVSHLPPFANVDMAQVLYEARKFKQVRTLHSRMLQTNQTRLYRYLPGGGSGGEPESVYDGEDSTAGLATSACGVKAREEGQLLAEPSGRTTKEKDSDVSDTLDGSFSPPFWTCWSLGDVVGLRQLWHEEVQKLVASKAIPSKSGEMLCSKTGLISLTYMSIASLPSHPSERQTIPYFLGRLL